MAPHSSTLAQKIPWMKEPGRLQSMGSLRVGHDSVTSLSLFTFMHWSRKWQPTAVFLPGESQGRQSLVGCHLWGRTELDTTEATQQQQQQQQQQPYSSRSLENCVSLCKICGFAQNWNLTPPILPLIDFLLVPETERVMPVTFILTIPAPCFPVFFYFSITVLDA